MTSVRQLALDLEQEGFGFSSFDNHNLQFLRGILPTLSSKEFCGLHGASTLKVCAPPGCKNTLPFLLKGFFSQEIACTENYLYTPLEPQVSTDEADTKKMSYSRTISQVNRS